MSIKRILIVDDSPTERHVLNDMLTKAGYEVVASDNGEDAIVKARTIKPDLILMDVVMPGLNGFQATRAISRDPTTRSVPIIMCTSKSQETDKIWGLRQGARDYIVKPVKRDELLAKITAFTRSPDEHAMARTAKLDLRAFQQELATRLAAKTAAQVEQSRLGVGCAGEQWLIRLADAGEVIAIPQLATVPRTKPWYLGVANIRGNLYGVIDFAGFLGRPVDVTGPGAGQSRLVLFGPRVGELRAGIIVQRVLGLRNLAELVQGDSHAGAPAWYGSRWADRDGQNWQEIDLARLAQDPGFLQVGL